MTTEVRVWGGATHLPRTPWSSATTAARAATSPPPSSASLAVRCHRAPRLTVRSLTISPIRYRTRSRRRRGTRCALRSSLWLTIPAPVVHQAPAPVAVKPTPAPQPVVVHQVVQPQAPKKPGRCSNSTKDKSTTAFVCYNCGYGSHAETDCVVCGTYMRSNKQDAKLCLDCGWTNFPENCAHCNQPLGSTKIRGYACSDCTTGAQKMTDHYCASLTFPSGPNLNKCCKLRPNA